MADAARPDSQSPPDATAPTLKLRRIALDTHRENVALLSRDCELYRAEEFEALRKIEIFADGHSLIATLMISDEPGLPPPDELGLTNQAFRQLGLEEGVAVTIRQAPPPVSLSAIRRKAGGHELSRQDLEEVIGDIVGQRYSEMEIAAFLIASASFMTTREVLALTEAMADADNRLKWDPGLVVDKHCIGGIPGNRTSMLVVPIVAAHGLRIPKTSSRAITSPSGTADTMEVLASVDLSNGAMREVVEKTNGCLVWGGRVNLSPADDILISVERPLGIDTREQMVASIMSKKLAAGSTNLVIDLPVGPTAKVRNHRDAIRLRKLFEFVGDRLGLALDVVVTDGRQPVGRGVGPVLEVRDVMAVLRGQADAPEDLRERALLLAGHILEFDPALRGGAGIERARELLESGAALDTMEAIIDAQGRRRDVPQPGELTREVRAGKSGWVTAIDCFRIARIARLAGAPMDPGAGIDLLKKCGDRVHEGDPIYRIHACVRADFDFACQMADCGHGYSISSERGETF